MAASLVAAPVALLIGLWQLNRPPVVVAAETSGGSTTEPPDGAAAFATVALESWLTLDAEAAPDSGLWAGVSERVLPENAVGAEAVRTLAVEPGDRDGEWVATLLADTTVGRAYFALTVVDAGGQLAVRGMPWLVASPDWAAREAAAEQEPVPSSHPLRATVEGFLVGYQAGEDVQRWLSPDAEVVTSTPSPLGAVEIVDVLAVEVPPSVPPDGASVTVLVSAELAPTSDDAEHGELPPAAEPEPETATATASTAGGATSEPGGGAMAEPSPGGPSAPDLVPADTPSVRVDYPVTLTGRDGRWEVSSLPGSVAHQSATPIRPTVPSPSNG